MSGEENPPLAYVACSCCGRLIENNAEENTYWGEVPYPGDFGTGLCRACGGDPDANDARKRLGYALCVIVDARIPILADKLSEERRRKFLALDYADKAHVILTFIGKGLLA